LPLLHNAERRNFAGKFLLDKPNTFLTAGRKPYILGFPAGKNCTNCVTEKDLKKSEKRY